MSKSTHRLFAVLRKYARQRRYREICKLTKCDALSGFILDLGGGAATFFASLFPRQDHVILADISEFEVRMAKRKNPLLLVVVADGQRLPFANGSIGLTICNSVIEHVDDPSALAQEIRRVSQTYFLQTPNGHFPLEMHSHTPIPFYRFIPNSKLRRWICKIFGAQAEYVESVRYLLKRELRALFPEAKIAYERILCLKKSFYVYYLGVEREY